MDSITPRIQYLSPSLASRLAAGEVIERPASVLKELVENALDAKARHIYIDCEEGGINLIRVRDDGCGIHPEDLPLALASRTTSKITQEEDLLDIHTLGFRGEALASIDTVSHLSLSSCIPNEDHGWKIDTDKSIRPIAHPVGTTVEMRNLFYNLPARRKFLRSEKSEFLRLKKILAQLALSDFQVGIKAHHNGKLIYHLPSRKNSIEYEKRIVEVCGQSFFQNSIYIEEEIGELRLWGWLGRPEFSRKQNTLQYFYVNQRMVQDRVLGHGVRQAYAKILPQSCTPAYVLYLKLPTDQVDVNVHPTKSEVRLTQGWQIHNFIVAILTDALKEEKSSKKFKYFSPSYGIPPTDHKVADNAPIYLLQPLPSENDDSLFGQAKEIILKRYLLVEKPTELTIIHIPLAQTYLLQKKLYELYAQGNITKKPLLFPLTLKVSIEQAEWVESNKDSLFEAGFDLSRLGEDLIILREAISIMKGLDFKAFLATLLPKFIQQNQEELNLTLMQDLVINTITPNLLSDLSFFSQLEMDSFLQELVSYFQRDPSPKIKFWRAISKREIDSWFILAKD
ncbi:DNA mismatch repair endonuclease MutL [Candidatus Nitrosacidococcus sp. I8]|uniref:DNA mismatch repair endonuclease MutL n=1 Tax=Candidatus Nitrosacidococcus sp. I8 TaxID=2942908 RepID=UPI0022274BF5|nr:DNA mismatch repair endonuclease MutL [Candidatus Nitrosacidococcus sp. I8]CAH9016976.1 DNA mismatch repair protein MutL [Candidatus Nitrosacidococcus sp. I8]